MYRRYSTRRRRFKDLLKSRLRSLFEIGQRLGVDVLPRHFYSSIPDIRRLKTDDAWMTPYSMVGIGGADLSEQFRFIGCCCSKELIELQRKRDVFAEAAQRSGELGFGPNDAEFLFCFIASHLPRRILQIGCGVSTALMQLALEHAGHESHESEITCIEPYPSDYLRTEKREGRIRLVEQLAECVDTATLTALGDGDLLFVDSTHSLRPGGEVPRIILEVLPRLAPGCWVHFHDIWFPYNYPPSLLTDELFFSGESLVLQAFLIGNSGCRLSASLSMLYHADTEQLARYLPNVRRLEHPHGQLTSQERYPMSAYLRMVGPQ